MPWQFAELPVESTGAPSVAALTVMAQLGKPMQLLVNTACAVAELQLPTVDDAPRAPPGLP